MDPLKEWQEALLLQLLNFFLEKPSLKYLVKSMEVFLDSFQGAFRDKLWRRKIHERIQRKTWLTFRWNIISQTFLKWIVWSTLGEIFRKILETNLGDNSLKEILKEFMEETLEKLSEEFWDESSYEPSEKELKKSLF